ncbi:hypothetical protein [Trujillonella humicola]|uniref:hypothetical protein n=1 Tax=Trujillonella humicola TaxID=3383699 RepID=UPI0039060E97
MRPGRARRSAAWQLRLSVCAAVLLAVGGTTAVATGSRVGLGIAGAGLLCLLVALVLDLAGRPLRDWLRRGDPDAAAESFRVSSERADRD